MQGFWLSFVPLFVAVDAIGVLPMFITLTDDIDDSRIKWIVIQSVITASIVAILFLIVGNSLLKVLGITVSDFMIAGGLLLFIISLNDILSIEKKQRQVDVESLGSVPIGVPLIVGPAVLTTTMLLVSQHGILIPIIATIINIVIAGVIFLLARPIYKLIGKPGAKTISKLASLLLAAIGIMMVRRGLLSIFSQFLT